MTRIEVLKNNEKAVDELIEAGFLDFRTKRNMKLYYKVESLIIAGMSLYRAAGECEHTFRTKDIKCQQIMKIYNEYRQKI